MGCREKSVRGVTSACYVSSHYELGLLLCQGDLLLYLRADPLVTSGTLPLFT